MPASRLDHDGGHWADRDAFAIKFHFAAAFEDDVNFGHRFVIMRLRIRLDVDLVDTSDIVFRRNETATRRSTGTRLSREFIQLGNQIIFRGSHSRSIKEPCDEWTRGTRR